MTETQQNKILALHNFGSQYPNQNSPQTVSSPALARPSGERIQRSRRAVAGYAAAQVQGPSPSSPKFQPQQGGAYLGAPACQPETAFVAGEEDPALQCKIYIKGRQYSPKVSPPHATCLCGRPVPYTRLSAIPCCPSVLACSIGPNDHNSCAR